MQYLVTMDFVDPGPLLPTEQYVGMMRQVVLPGHEALKTLKSEGKILAGGVSCWRAGYSVYRRVRFSQGARRVTAVHTFLGDS
jgi:hypothetical protein